MRINYLILLIVMSLIINCNGQTQKKKLPLLYEPFISVGYLNITNNLATDYYKIILDSYRSMGIPIPTQVDFGSTLSTKGGVYLSLSKTVSIGLALGYIYSNAYSGYKDYAGTLKVNGTIQSYTISFVGRGTITNIADFPLNIFIEAGSSYATASIIEKLLLNEYPQNNLDTKWSAKAWGPFIQSTFGTDFLFGIMTVSPQVGYCLNFNNVSPDFNKDIYIKYGTNLDRLSNIGQSGIIFLVKFGINLSKSRE